MTSETSQVKAGPEAVSTGIKEIIVPKVNGVYMLGELQHKRKDRRWSCGFVYYIGQSEDLAQRLIAHRGPKSGLNLRNCRMLILSGPSEHYGVTTRQRL